MEGSTIAWLLLALEIGLQLFFVGRALLRPYREPVSRLAWVMVIVVAPLIGMIAYILVGETNIGRTRTARLRKAFETLPPPLGTPDAEAQLPEGMQALFRAGTSVSGYPPVAGNRAQLLESSDAAIEAMVADIDTATDHVHLLFYIWLPDTNGLKIVAALQRAAGRGVACRVMADDVGSRAMIRSEHWRAMREAGVQLARAMPIGNPLVGALWGRLDMRNHRKIVVIDNAITYCGSQNCADAAFLPKARFAPWVDVMVRLEGPIARQNQHLFASDWMGHGEDDLTELLQRPLPPAQPGFVAQVIGTGATVRPSAMPEIFVSVMNAARRELVITTPYYVPDETIQAALCASAYRGVETTFIVPERNDSWVVAAASHSYYAELLEAGVMIREYQGGLLHSKTMTVDGQLALIGSANMDRRSFELNFENNMLIADRSLTQALRQRQQSYIEASVLVHAAEVEAWGGTRRIWNNTVAMLGPVL
ncbi:MAG TPA: cardiolipin synthase [Devosia sp.]|jgi:cardiolipin synthase|uniref:cardiolipin synthase n=1 Tax=Devosia sp. TaxID=1871048 RepID=UPI002DDC94BD|nr:cardiolipin synthase [Devosia sp.]HEV2513704.1 cardiolipin synthase [Devosia sp.]